MGEREVNLQPYQPCLGQEGWKGVKKAHTDEAHTLESEDDPPITGIPPSWFFIKTKDVSLGGTGTSIPLASLEMLQIAGLKILGEDTEKRDYSYVRAIEFLVQQRALYTILPYI